MAEKPPQFIVTDRRKFTTEGDIREGYTEPEPTPEPTPVAAQQSSAAPIAESSKGPQLVGAESESAPSLEEEPFVPNDYEDQHAPPPTAQETAEQHTAYKQSSRDLDEMIRKANPGIPANPEADFEQLVQSMYLSAAMAMGAGTEPGQKPRIDIIGARQSIDLLSVLGEKTKGNLTSREQQFLQNALFDVRMMFLELTKAIAAQAKRPPAGSPLK